MKLFLAAANLTKLFIITCVDLYFGGRMFKNYFKIALRNILKYKGFSFINIIGLAVGIAICILILIYVHHELNYDKFHENADNIYRVLMKYHVGTNQFTFPLSPCPLADAMAKDLPEVRAATRIYQANYRGDNVYVKYDKKQFKEENFYYADSTVFEVLTIPLIRGDQKTALKEPNSMIVTTEMAVKYFGTEDPMNKMLMLQDGVLYKVTGVCQKWPENSHFLFDYLDS